MEGKTTHILFGEERICETKPLYQYDYGQELSFDDIELPSVFEVFFQNGVIKDAEPVLGYNGVVAIPDALFDTGKNIVAFVFLHEDSTDGETEYVVRIPVRPRSKVPGDEITPEEYRIVSELVAVVQTVADKTEQMESTVSQLTTAVNSLTAAVNSLVDRVTVLENRVPALGGWKTN